MRRNAPWLVALIAGPLILATGLDQTPGKGQAVKPAGQQVEKDPPDEGPKKDPKEPKELTIKSKITKDDPFDAKRKESHCKVHVVKMQPGYDYVIDLKADPLPDKDMPSFDAFLRLEDAGGKHLAENDDYITTDSRITFRPEKEGEYRIVCTTFDGGFTGSYTLTVNPTKGGAKANDPKVVFSKNDTLTNKNEMDDKRTGSYHKVHLFKMQKGKTYQIDMISTQFDSYLRLEDPDGTQLLEDDDSGGMLNAQIIYQATKTGTFRVIATTFAPNATGMYLLKISVK